MTMRWITPALALAPAAPQFVVGDRVIAFWKGGRNPFVARITAVTVIVSLDCNAVQLVWGAISTPTTGCCPTHARSPGRKASLRMTFGTAMVRASVVSSRRSCKMRRRHHLNRRASAACASVMVKCPSVTAAGPACTTVATGWLRRIGILGSASAAPTPGPPPHQSPTPVRSAPKWGPRASSCASGRRRRRARGCTSSARACTSRSWRSACWNLPAGEALRGRCRSPRLQRRQQTRLRPAASAAKAAPAWSCPAPRARWQQGWGRGGPRILAPLSPSRWRGRCGEEVDVFDSCALRCVIRAPGAVSGHAVARGG